MTAVSESSDASACSATTCTTMDTDDEARTLGNSSDACSDNNSLIRKADIGISSDEGDDDGSQKATPTRVSSNSGKAKRGKGSAKSKSASSFKTPKRVHFPTALFDLVSSADTKGFGSIVSWSEDGTSLVVHNPSRFMTEVAPRYFPKQSQFRSFERMLNLWCFVRQESAKVTQSTTSSPPRLSPMFNQQVPHHPRPLPARRPYAYPKDTKIYHHIHFQRGKREECSLISRCGIKGTSVRMNGITFNLKSARSLSVQSKDASSDKQSTTPSKSGSNPLKKVHSDRSLDVRSPTSVMPSPQLPSPSTLIHPSARSSTRVAVAASRIPGAQSTISGTSQYMPRRTSPNPFCQVPGFVPSAPAPPAIRISGGIPAPPTFVQHNHRDLTLGRHIQTQHDINQLLRQRQLQISTLLLHQQRDAASRRAQSTSTGDRGFLDLLATSASRVQVEEKKYHEPVHTFERTPVPGQFDDPEDDSDEN